jgi:FAD/FMN-containing dehydrogenase
MQIDQLKPRIAGRIVLPGESDYDQLRQVLPGNINRRPAAIVLVSNAQDIQATLDFAKRNGVKLAVRSGGHSAAGYGVIDDGIVVDLRNLKQIKIDPETRTVSVESGATAGQVTDELAKHGLVVGFGDTGSVGVGGITTSGGVGYLVRKFGLAIDNLLAVEIVTADGSLLQANAQEHSDLFWAVRGGGGNFGVITRFKFQAQPLSTAYGGMMILPATADVIAQCMRIAENAPDELSAIFNIMPAPPMPMINPELYGKLIIMALIMYAGSAEKGKEVIAPLRDVATPLADMAKEMEYKDIFFPHDDSYHPLAVSKNMFMKAVDEKMAELILHQLMATDAPMRAVQLRVLGGAAGRVPANATAYAHRSNPIMVNVAAFYSGAEDLDEKTAWMNETVNLLDQGVPGLYVGFATGEGENEVSAAYPAHTLSRLQEIKKRYDPENIFRSNLNIQPA